MQTASSIYSMLRSLRAVDRADIALLVLDAATGVVEQDKKIGGYIHEAGKGLIIVVNKWDLAAGAGPEDFAPAGGSTPGGRAAAGPGPGGRARSSAAKDARAKFEHHVRTELDFINYAAIQYVSSLNGKGIGGILDLIDEVYQQLTRRIGTGNLNSWLNETIYLNPPPAFKGQETKIYYAAQVSVKPPTFVFFVNHPEHLHFSYKRHLERRLREAYGFKGAPLRLIFRQRQQR